MNLFVSFYLETMRYYFAETFENVQFPLFQSVNKEKK